MVKKILYGVFKLVRKHFERWTWNVLGGKNAFKMLSGPRRQLQRNPGRFNCDSVCFKKEVKFNFKQVKNVKSRESIMILKRIEIYFLFKYLVLY